MVIDVRNTRDHLEGLNIRTVYERLVKYESEIDGYIELYPNEHEAYDLKKRYNYLIRCWLYEHDCYSSDAHARKLDSNDSEVKQFKSDMIELIEELNEFLKK